MNHATMRVLFEAWNADNNHARAAYEERLAELEKPRLCRRRLHLKPDDQRGSCKECRNNRERDRRAGRQPSTRGGNRLTEEQKDQVVALYTDELLPPAEIYPQFQISRNTVINVLIERGVSLRGNADAYEALLERRRRLADEANR